MVHTYFLHASHGFLLAIIYISGKGRVIINEYKSCKFRSMGIITFRCANPYISQVFELPDRDIPDNNRAFGFGNN